MLHLNTNKINQYNGLIKNFFFYFPSDSKTMKVFSEKPLWSPQIRLKGKVSFSHSLCSQVQMATADIVLIANCIPNE